MLRQASGPFDPIVDVLMTRRPITIARGATVALASTLMRTCRVRHLPVVDGETLAGMLSLREVLGAPDATLVAAVATPAATVAPETPLAVACQKMLDEHVSGLAVVDRGHLAGVFTATDALRFATAALEDEARTLRHPPDVAQLMTARPLVVVAPTSSLSCAWDLMQRMHVRHLPVVQDEAVIGILSDRDLLQAGKPALAAAPAETAPTVGDAMSARLSTIAAERPAAEAARTLLRRRVGALPVLRGTRLVGILTVADFLYWILSRS